MPTHVLMPSLGFDMTEGKLARWLMKEGDRIEKGQAIAEIETEKATVEIEATASGVLAKIIVQAGQTVPVGTVIGVIAEAGEKVAETPAAPTPPSPAAPAPPSPAAPPPPVTTDKGETAEPSEARVKASPVARRMAEEAGIDLGRIQGSGPSGRIMERDVQAAIAATPSPPRPAVEARPAPAAPIPMSRMRQAIARRMTESKKTAPHFYVTVEIHMDEAMKLREQLNRLAADDEKISVNDLIVAASARTLARFPALNASYRDDRIEMHPGIHIGIAVALDDGLIPPVLHDADKKSLRTI